MVSVVSVLSVVSIVSVLSVVVVVVVVTVLLINAILMSSYMVVPPGMSFFTPGFSYVYLSSSHFSIFMSLRLFVFPMSCPERTECERNMHTKRQTRGCLWVCMSVTVSFNSDIDLYACHSMCMSFCMHALACSERSRAITYQKKASK